MSKQGDEIEKRPVGRPALERDYKLAESLAQIQCTDYEIYSTLNISCDTFYRWKREDEEFSECLKRGRALGTVSVRRSLFKQSKDGNIAATIFLAKNYCGMTDRVDVKIDKTINYAKIAESENPSEILHRLDQGEVIDAEYYVIEGESTSVGDGSAVVIEMPLPINIEEFNKLTSGDDE